MFNIDADLPKTDASEADVLRPRRRRNISSCLAVLALGLTLAACGDDADDSPGDGGSADAGKGGSGGKGSAGKGGSAGKAGGGAGKSGASGASEADDAGVAEGGDKDAHFALLSAVGTADETVTYFKVLDAIAPQEIKYDDAREFSGSADAWVYDGAVFIMDAESQVITKYEFESGKLVEDAKISFSNYGLKDFGFWVNTFLSPTKAYLVNGTTEYVVWNPKTMEITGTVPMPELAARGNLKPFASYTDRSTVVRDGLLYHPFYYTDDDYFAYSESSSIAVYDVKTDKLVRVIDAPCPGLDYATQDADGNLYFSAWIFAPGGAAQLDQPATCVAKIAKSADVATKAFTIKDVADGHEGGVLRFTGNGKGILSVFHPEHASGDEKGDAALTTYGNNWRFWAYDFATGKATLIDALDWNSGAAYSAAADGKSYMLIPIDGYAATVVYDITKPAEPKKVFEANGWVLRLIKLPS